MQRLDSECLAPSDDSYSSGDDWDLEAEAGHSSRTVLEVSPLGEEGPEFTLRLATSHHSFSLGRSVVTRSAEAFYQLQVTHITTFVTY